MKNSMRAKAGQLLALLRGGLTVFSCNPSLKVCQCKQHPKQLPNYPSLNPLRGHPAVRSLTLT